MNRLTKSFLLSATVHILTISLLVYINIDKKDYSSNKEPISIEIENISIPKHLDTMQEVKEKTKKELIKEVKEKIDNNEIAKEDISVVVPNDVTESDIYSDYTKDKPITHYPITQSNNIDNRLNHPKSTKQNGINSEEGKQKSSIPSDYYQPKTAPTISYFYQPVYPENLRRRNKQSQVTLQLLVSESGLVESVTILNSSGYGEMDSSAIDAAYNYRFNPAYNNYGNPVQCYATITIYFTLQ